ncbi:MAG: hypothetical protein ACJA1Y_001387, partial [Burkholderiaceae bacterium]
MSLQGITQHVNKHHRSRRKQAPAWRNASNGRRRQVPVWQYGSEKTNLAREK